jgi:hypothetical protein
MVVGGLWVVGGFVAFLLIIFFASATPALGSWFRCLVFGCFFYQLQTALHVQVFLYPAK